MTNPNWLDEERRGMQVYAKTIHPACVCTWVDGKPPGESEPMHQLAVRNRVCVIHGKNGSH